MALRATCSGIENKKKHTLNSVFTQKIEWGGKQPTFYAAKKFNPAKAALERFA